MPTALAIVLLRRQALVQWKKNNSRNATYGNLAKAFREAEREDLVDEICQVAEMNIGFNTENREMKLPTHSLRCSKLRKYYQHRYAFESTSKYNCNIVNGKAIRAYNAKARRT